MNQILKVYSDLIKSFLASFLSEKSRILQRINNWGYDLSERLKEFSIEGKIIRGSLLLLIQDLYANKINDESVKLAAAVELFHSGLLIHDDIMDRDEERRGKRSLYYQYKLLSETEAISDPDQFGISMGICAGDIGFFLGFDLIVNLELDLTLKNKVSQLFINEFINVGLGQMQDIYFGQSKRSFKEKEEIIKLYLYKTARYTFSLPFTLGGLLSGIDENELGYLEELGESLGLIFQFKDDELGIFGMPGSFGKPIGSDIEEGKKTLYYTYLLQMCNEEEKQQLSSIFGSSNISNVSLEYVRSLIYKYNIKKEIDKRIESYTSNAQNIILKMNIDNKAKAKLKDIIEYNLTRIK